MAVPNTTTFSLQDVVDEVNPTTDDLLDCVSDANTGDYDASYFSAPATSLLEFRNYTDSATGTNTLTRSPNTLSFSRSASTQTFSVDSNTTWSATDDQSWITISSASGSGNDASVNCNVTENTTGGTRSGRITVQTTSGTPYKSTTITVTQSSGFE